MLFYSNSGTAWSSFANVWWQVTQSGFIQVAGHDPGTGYPCGLFGWTGDAVTAMGESLATFDGLATKYKENYPFGGADIYSYNDNVNTSGSFTMPISAGDSFMVAGGTDCSYKSVIEYPLE